MSTPDVIDVTDATFADTLGTTPTVIDFAADWCAPCRVFAPVFDGFAQRVPELRFARCDVDANPQVAARYRVMSIPTVVVADVDGTELARQSGAVSTARFAAFLAPFTGRPAAG